MILNSKGSAVIQAMLVVAFLSVLIGTVMTQNDLSVAQVRRSQQHSQFEALGRYIAALGEDNLLCINNVRLDPSFTLPANYNAVIEKVNIQVQLPLLNTPGTWYPQANPENNYLSRFDNILLTGVALRDLQYSKCNNSALPCSQNMYMLDSAPEFQGNLVVYGRAPGNEPDRPGFVKNVARMKIKVSRATNSLISCFSTITDQEFCEQKGARYYASSPQTPQDRALCRFPAADIPPCAGPDEFISDIAPDGTPICSKIEPCGEEDGEQTYAVGIANNRLVCQKYPRPIYVQDSEPPPASTIATIMLRARAHCKGYVISNSPNVTNGTLDVTSTDYFSNSQSGSCTIDSSQPSSGLDHYECSGSITYNGDTQGFSFHGTGSGAPSGTLQAGGVSFTVSANAGGSTANYGLVCHVRAN